MATRWFANRKAPLGIVLFTISLAISGCDKTPTPPSGLLDSREAQQAGDVIFAANCAICHGVNGDGHGQRRAGIDPPPANLTLPPWSETAEAGKTFLAIRNGVPRTAMPAWPHLSDAQVWDVVAHIISLKGS